MTLPPIPEGFTQHEGGPCPVGPDVRVDVVFADTARACDTRAGTWGDGGTYDWWQGRAADPNDNIIAYRRAVQS